MCQRYFEQIAEFQGLVMSCYNTTDAYGLRTYQVIKRATPSVTISGTTTLFTANSSKSGTLSANNIYTDSINYKFVTTGLTSGYAGHANNTGGSAAVAISAEL